MNVVMLSTPRMKATTKAELQKHIETLDAEIRELRKAVSALSSKEAMEIRLPVVARDVPKGNAPYLREGLMERLVVVMEPSLRKHGARLLVPAKSHLRLSDNIYRGHGDPIVVPVVWGEVMAEIMDCAAAFARECYADGFRAGSDLLGRLSRGEITTDGFEKALAEEPVRRQEHKDIRNLIK
jgi:hypothetical protein